MKLNENMSIEDVKKSLIELGMKEDDLSSLMKKMRGEIDTSIDLGADMGKMIVSRIQSVYPESDGASSVVHAIAAAEEAMRQIAVYLGTLYGTMIVNKDDDITLFVGMDRAKDFSDDLKNGLINTIKGAAVALKEASIDEEKNGTDREEAQKNALKSVTSMSAEEVHQAYQKHFG